MKRAIFAAAILGVTSFQTLKATVINFDDPAFPADVTFSSTGNAEVVSGDVTNSYDAPYENGIQDTTDYLAVLAGGTASFAFSTPQDSLSLLWGSIDNYNVITFSDNGNTVATVTGAEYNPTGLTGEAGSQIVAIGGFTFDSFTLSSGSNSFEVDNLVITAVPEPSTWALLTIGTVAGFAGFLRRRSLGV